MSSLPVIDPSATAHADEQSQSGGQSCRSPSRGDWPGTTAVEERWWPVIAVFQARLFTPQVRAWRVLACRPRHSPARLIRLLQPAVAAGRRETMAIDGLLHPPIGRCPYEKAKGISGPSLRPWHIKATFRHVRTRPGFGPERRQTRTTRPKGNNPSELRPPIECLPILSAARPDFPQYPIRI
jgi:hypothetical protein